MVYYQINDINTIKKAESILAAAQLWYDGLSQIAQKYGFDKVVLKGRNAFYQYAVLEFAIHESHLMRINLDDYEFLSAITVHPHETENSSDLIAGIYHVFKPLDKQIAQELGNYLNKIGLISPKKEILSLLCREPNKIMQIFWVGLSSALAQQQVIYQTPHRVENNHSYCATVDPEILINLLHANAEDMSNKEKIFDLTALNKIVA